MEEFKDAFQKGNLFASGVAVDYGASIIVTKDGDAPEQGDGTDVSLKQKALGVIGHQELATNIKIGMRMPSFQVLNQGQLVLLSLLCNCIHDNSEIMTDPFQADARPHQFQEMLKSDGRWRIVVFAGDVANSVQMTRVCKLGDALSVPKSFSKRFTPPKTTVDSLVEILTIHSAPRPEIELFDFPEIFRPCNGRDGWDYWKVYADDKSYHEGHGHAYEKYGVDASKGCVIILRPDQYVGWIGQLEDVEEIDQYFSGFMIPRS